MAQQTAVEWLDRWFRDNPEATHEEGNKALQQAKQMEKEQILDAYSWGECNIDNDGCHIDKNGAEQYYNETYGK